MTKKIRLLIMVLCAVFCAQLLTACSISSPSDHMEVETDLSISENQKNIYVNPDFDKDNEHKYTYTWSRYSDSIEKWVNIEEIARGKVAVTHQGELV